jgi:hypothetical protein
MTQPSSTIQQVLAATLLDMLRSPDLAREDAEWLRQFAFRTIAEFNSVKSEDEMVALVERAA